MRALALAFLLAALPIAARAADCGPGHTSTCSLPVGGRLLSGWTRPGQRQWYRMELRGGRRYEAWLDDHGQACGFLGFRDRWGRALEEVFYGHPPPGYLVSARFTPPRDGTYFLVVAEAFCDAPIIPRGYALSLQAR